MPRKTVEDYKAELADLKDEVAELEEENEDLQDRLDYVLDIVAPEQEEDEAGDEADAGE